MNEIFQWIYNVFLVLYAIIIIVFNIARVVYFFKCFKIKDCSNQNCHFKEFCDKYHEVLMEDEKDLIRKILEE
ncbi:MAG: hypothetical protein K2O91_11210 [Lachnospiraceae bacterium]|nr:hypothetical protein [Lachnospiraceae bacterium]